MFEGVAEIAAQDRAVGEDGLRRVAWAELAAAISLSRALHKGERGLLAQAGPSFDRPRSPDHHEAKDQRGVNPVSLASRKASGGKELSSAESSPERHRENR